VCNEPTADISVAVDLFALAEQIELVYTCMNRFWQAIDRQLASPPPAQWRRELETAVIEIANNIVRHAYPPSAAATMQIELTCNGCCVEVHLRDYGVPFTKPLPMSQAELPNPLDLPEGGWGLHIVRAAVDELSYTREEDANHWRLCKFIQM